jgi:DNA-binding MarR family transcriptional regulator
MPGPKQLSSLCLLLGDFRLTLEDLAILAHLEECGDADYPAIAIACRFNPLTLRRYIKSLRDRDLVCRVSEGADARLVRLRIAPAGTALLASILSESTKHEIPNQKP